MACPREAVGPQVVCRAVLELPRWEGSMGTDRGRRAAGYHRGSRTRSSAASIGKPPGPMTTTSVRVQAVLSALSCRVAHSNDVVGRCCSFSGSVRSRTAHNPHSRTAQPPLTSPASPPPHRPKAPPAGRRGRSPCGSGNSARGSSCRNPGDTLPRGRTGWPP